MKISCHKVCLCKSHCMSRWFFSHHRALVRPCDLLALIVGQPCCGSTSHAMVVGQPCCGSTFSCDGTTLHAFAWLPCNTFYNGVASPQHLAHFRRFLSQWCNFLAQGCDISRTGAPPPCTVVTLPCMVAKLSCAVRFHVLIQLPCAATWFFCAVKHCNF